MLSKYITINPNNRYSLFLYSGFGLLLVVFVSLAAFHFKQIVTANETLREITANNDIQLRSAMNMRVAVRERALLLWQMSFQEDDFERDDLYLKFNIFGTRFGHARSEYLITRQTQSERNLFVSLNKETNSRAPALREFADMLMEGVERDEYASHLNKALTDQIVVSDILDTIIRLQQTQNEDARKQIARITAGIILQLTIWMLVFVVAVILFARVVVRVANKQANRLSKVNDELNLLARHDHLTKLPNRLFLSEHLELTLSHAKRHNKFGALLYIDLDDFKPINDTYGHSVGDAYLQAVSLAIKDLLRDSDILVRLGGDEFVVVLYEMISDDDAYIVAKKLLKVLSSEYSLQGVTVSASASVGIRFFPDEGMSVDSLLSSADSAMYDAKQAGKNNFIVHQSTARDDKLKSSHGK